LWVKLQKITTKCALLLYIATFCFLPHALKYVFFILCAAESAFRHEVLPFFFSFFLFSNIFPANCNSFKKIYHKPFTSIRKERCPESLQRSSSVPGRVETLPPAAEETGCAAPPSITSRLRSISHLYLLALASFTVTY